MRSKTIIGVSVALLMVLILVSPALADSVRGKLERTSDIDSTLAKSAGAFLFTTNEFNWVTFSIKVRKLVPNEKYRVGWIEYKNGDDDRLIYETVTADSKGNIKHVFTNAGIYDSTIDWTFIPFVAHEYYDVFLLLGPEVFIFF